ncbi:MAG: hypothetical protein HYW25_03575 [Candidatus Aenigmarchaeota archaeon]|nr:hypothetical protein [Candidatus Aenigmarchaeota archaeon]
MPKIEMREDLFAPGREISIQFNGKNPLWIVGNAMRLLRDTLKVSAVNLREDKIKWDVLGDPASFYGEWRGLRTEDQWTRTLLKIRCQGKHGKDGYGSVTVWLRGFILTTYEHNNPISLLLWKIYNYSFYHKQRRAYLEGSKGDLLSIRTQIQEAYGILQEA